jgi:two-component system nitrate/nitrite response regulator NarL
MKAIIISDSVITRKGISTILKNQESINLIKESNDIEDIHLDEYGLIMIDLSREKEQYLQEIINLKKRSNTPVMIVDFYKDSNLFFQCMRLDIDGYIVSDINQDDIEYAIRQVLRGKKYYDSDLMKENVCCGESNNLELLTKREYQILSLVAQGKSNKEIGQALEVAENTVKKHVQNMLAKLDLKDRTQAAIFAYNTGVVN